MKQKLILPLLLLSLLLSMGNLQKRREALADRIAPSILRFLILANSDSKTDQAVKLEVRDAIIQELGDMDGAQTSQEERGFRLAFQKQNQPGDCRQPFSCRKANAL